MPKAGYASADAYEPKLGIQEGWVEIVGARTQVTKYPESTKETGRSNEPFLAAIIDFQRTNEQGDHLDEEVTDKILRIEKDLSKMRPGQAASREDSDPEDQGSELDTVGNCIYTDSSKLNTNSGWMMFVKSLEAKGYRPDILGQGFLPDLVGVKGHVTTIKGEKRVFAGKESDTSYLVFDKLTVRPYEAAASKGKKAAGKASTANGKTNGAPAVPTAAPAAAKAVKPSGNNEAADEAATSILMEVAGELDGESREFKKFFSMAFSKLMKNKERDKYLDKPVQDLLRSEDWAAAKAVELEGVVGYADGVISFGSAAAA